MRIAFFGGSFDPPHNGHLAIARVAMERLGLDRVLLAPVGRQPLKQSRLPAKFADRLAMVTLASEGEARIEVSDLDAPRADGFPNYSFDTLTQFKKTLKNEDQLYMLLGADSFLTISSWFRAPELMQLCDWIVAGRPGSALQEISTALPSNWVFHGEPEISAGLVTQRIADKSVDGPDGRMLYVLPDLHENVSATEVRAALADGNANQLPLPPSVIEYICAHGLYQEASPSISEPLRDR